ncbi:MAG: GWxTD domain-containing protein [Candidatus Latescibacteria bacterium]|jgi:GWxTD domain-containing protein|nr:GWxTD domain-containing protein [Candidatus Latescibacterota bacterium]
MRRFSIPMLRIYGCVFVLLAVAATSSAQRLPEFPVAEQGPGFVVMDLLTTRGVSPDSTRVDVYYRLSNDIFTFIRSTGDKFVAHYELSLLINDRDGFQMLGETYRDSLVADTELESRVTDNSQALLYSTALPPGKYNLVMNILDVETKDEVNFSRRFEVPDYFRNELSISDLQFAGLITPEDSGDASEFGVNVVPNLARAYGEDQTQMYVYYELYTTAPRASKKPLKVKYRIKASSGKEQLKVEEELPRQGGTGIYSRKFETKGFAQGAYSLEIEVRDEAIKKSAKMKGVFYVSWKYLLPLTSAKNYREILEQIKYVGTKEEMKTLENLKKSSSDEQQAALVAFWKKRDPSPETEKNENMLMYYRRIDFANQNFTAGIGSGWKSDQGRIYVIYGAPTEIERRSLESGTQPFQIWHYANLGRSFLFVDYDGYGRYELSRVY